MEGTLLRLTENLDYSALASRLVLHGDHGVNILKDEKVVLEDRMAESREPWSIIHRWHVKNATRTIHLATFLELSRKDSSVLFAPNGTKSLISTTWMGSISAVVFSRHLRRGIYTPQVASLAREWESAGRLDNLLRWCPLGNVPGFEAGQIYITKTAPNEQLRFFEAGNLHEKRQLLIRHGPAVSVFQCIQTAMQTTGVNTPLVIIA